MTTAKEWEHHIKRSESQAVCGAPIYRHGWVFQSVEHAAASIANRSRLLPCPDCAKVAGLNKGGEAAQ